jgi:HSP20 family molecular chaperone IbpA
MPSQADVSCEEIPGIRQFKSRKQLLRMNRLSPILRVKMALPGIKKQWLQVHSTGYFYSID